MCDAQKPRTANRGRPGIVGAQTRSEDRDTPSCASHGNQRCPLVRGPLSSPGRTSRSRTRAFSTIRIFSWTGLDCQGDVRHSPVVQVQGTGPRVAPEPDVLTGNRRG